MAVAKGKPTKPSPTPYVRTLFILHFQVLSPQNGTAVLEGRIRPYFGLGSNSYVRKGVSYANFSTHHKTSLAWFAQKSSQTCLKLYFLPGEQRRRKTTITEVSTTRKHWVKAEHNQRTVLSIRAHVNSYVQRITPPSLSTTRRKK